MFKKIQKNFKNKINKTLLITSFILFILILIYITIFKGVGIFYKNETISSNISYMIDKNILERLYNQFDFKNHKISLYILDLFKNIFLFLPTGLFLPLLNKNKFFINLLIAFLGSLIIETFQLFSGIGGFQIFDLILNCLGFLIGYGLFKLLAMLLEPKNLKTITINYISLIIIILFLPLAIFAYSEIIINFDIFLPCFQLENIHNLFSF